MSHLIFLIMFALFTLSCGDDVDKSDTKEELDHIPPADGICRGMVGGESVEWPYNGYKCNSVEGYADSFQAACESKCPDQLCEQPLVCLYGVRSMCDTQHGKYVCLDGSGRKQHDAPLVCVSVKCEDLNNN